MSLAGPKDSPPWRPAGLVVGVKRPSSRHARNDTHDPYKTSTVRCSTRESSLICAGDASSNCDSRHDVRDLYSITSSARPSSVMGNVRPSAFAVFMLTTNSIFTDCCTGRSAGFSPLRMRPA